MGCAVAIIVLTGWKLQDCAPQESDAEAANFLVIVFAIEDVPLLRTFLDDPTLRCNLQASSLIDLCLFREGTWTAHEERSNFRNLLTLEFSHATLTHPRPQPILLLPVPAAGCSPCS